MILIKMPNISPKKKWQYIIRTQPLKKPRFFYYYYKFKTHRRLTLQGSKNLYGLRFKHRTILFKFFLKKIKITPYIGLQYNFKLYPFKEFIWCKSIYGQVYPFLHTELTYPGFRLLPVDYILLKNNYYINQFLPMYLIPINTLISFVFNTKNQYMTYAKSSGVSAVKKKHLKKIKLNYVEFPSTKLKLFPLQTYCLLSTTANFFLHKIIQGGWGTFSSAKKVINVRGVAKNPVDHPNGGRTKAKQPELSPWGWIAKKNK